MSWADYPLVEFAFVIGGLTGLFAGFYSCKGIEWWSAYVRGRESGLKEREELQELAITMRICIEHACLCDFCPLFAAEDTDEVRCIADMDSRLRELGIEVGG